MIVEVDIFDGPGNELFELPGNEFGHLLRVGGWNGEASDEKARPFQSEDHAARADLIIGEEGFEGRTQRRWVGHHPFDDCAVWARGASVAYEAEGRRGLFQAQHLKSVATHI